MIVGTQILLPVTPALADELLESPSPVSNVTEEAPVPEPEESVMEAENPELAPDTEESSALETSAHTENDNESSHNNVIDDVEPESIDITNTELENEESTTSTSTSDESTDSSDGGESVDLVKESQDDGGVPTPYDDTGSSTAETNSTTTDEESPIVEEEVSSTTNPLTPLHEIPQTPVLVPQENVAIETEVSTDEEVLSTSTTTSTTTEEVAPTEMHTFSSDSMYTFNPNECARVADGSFYCVPETKTVAERTDRVFAAADKEGDSEIFIEKDGEITQLTFNQEEDAAPFYDGISKSIVFHRLIGARYQIVTLDLKTNEEEVLTHDSYNNMQPTRHGDVLVWQGWVGNDWEVVLKEGDEIRMITDNGTHDIGPYISGNYIIWQAENGTGWSVMVYDMMSEMTRSVDEADGASIENPRLVLVYDAKHENGDIETRGYDLISEKSVSLSSEAPILPSELPEPDQTGEERALITSVTQVKSKTGEDEGEPEEVPLVPVIPDTLGTTTVTDTLVVPPFASTTSALADVPIVEVLPSNEISPATTTPEDVEVTDIISSPGVEASHIPDLVIPSFDETVDAQTDSQDTVAETE